MNRARLISYSQGVDLQGAEDLIAYCARVSNPSNQDNTQRQPISY